MGAFRAITPVGRSAAIEKDGPDCYHRVDVIPAFCLGGTVTIRQLFIAELGKRKFESLPKVWKEHVRRVDSLPRPIKKEPPKAIAR